MTAQQASPPAAAEPARIRVRLSDLGVAPENLRAAEPADEDIPRLAETIRAAGLIYPPVVRRGRRGEARWMVLDGRRRRFALLKLAEAGVLAPDHEVECLLAVGRRAEAAAAVLPAAEHAPVHTADVIEAIGRLRKSRMDCAAIAGALGYDEAEVRRLAALAGVHPRVLEAYRKGRLVLRQVRLFARLPDRQRQAELAQAALDGWFHDHQLLALVQGGRVTADDARFALVGREAYAAAGGRLKEDLFGELPAEALDSDVLDAAWRTAAAASAQGLARAGLAVFLARERGHLPPDGLRGLPFVHWGGLDEASAAAFEAVRARIEAAAAAVEAAEAGEPRAAALGPLLDARLDLARLTARDGVVRAVLLTPSRAGLDATFYYEPEPRPPTPDAEEDGAGACGGEDVEPPEIPQVEVRAEVEGLGHAQHALRTDIATRGLIRDLADHPDAATVALTARLFRALALAERVWSGTAALTVSATAYGGAGDAVESLDGAVRARLAARREAYRASGLRPIPWVAGLGAEDRAGLLAELVAMSLDLHEPRTSAIRREARAEAQEIAGLCGADLSRHWTPDQAFFGAHGKAQLLGFLAEMEAGDARDATLRKAELVARVAAAAAARRWVPASLTFGASREAQEDDAGGDPEAQEDARG